MASKNPSELELWKDKEVMTFLYRERRMTQVEIAEMFGISQPTVYWWLNKLGIVREYEDPALLRKYYVIENRSISEMVARFDVSRSTIYRQLKEFGIKKITQDHNLLREEYVCYRKTPEEISRAYNTPVEEIEAAIEKFDLKPSWYNRDLLWALYEGLGMTLREIGEVFGGMDHTAVAELLEEHGIERRSKGTPSWSEVYESPYDWYDTREFQLVHKETLSTVKKLQRDIDEMQNAMKKPTAMGGAAVPLGDD